MVSQTPGVAVLDMLLVKTIYTACHEFKLSKLNSDGLNVVLQAVQQAMEDRLMGFREDMQASNQHLTQQFAQHQVGSLRLPFIVLDFIFAAARKQQHGIHIIVRPRLYLSHPLVNHFHH